MVVFFFKQKAAYEMRISDWSSDVCSSDLQGRDLLAGNQPIEAGFFYVKHLAAQRQNSLELTIAPLLCGTACRVTLDNIDFAQCGVFFLAVGQFARQAGAFKHAFTARHLACPAGCVARAGRFNKDRKSTRLNSSHYCASRMPSSA